MLTLKERMLAHIEALRDGGKPAPSPGVLLEAARSIEQTLPPDEVNAKKRAWTTMRLSTEETSDAAEDETSSQRMLSLWDLVTDASHVLTLEKAGDNESPNICIGRSKRSDVLIDHDTISSVHAILEVTGAFPVLIDHGSANGTFVNARKLNSGEPMALSSGDCIRFGKKIFYFVGADRVHFFLQLGIAKSTATRT